MFNARRRNFDFVVLLHASLTHISSRHVGKKRAVSMAAYKMEAKTAIL
jgi:hypothetical protein